ncbi:MAG: hypothetical protein AAGI52_01745 [Bacteroidota bacterium]
MSSVLRLRFGTAQHGWLPVLLEVEGQTHAFQASHVPFDFVGEVTEAASVFLSTGADTLARMSEEPGMIDWRFGSEGERAVLRIVTFSSGTRTEAEGVVTAEVFGSSLGLVVPVWRALRDLESRVEDEDYRLHWGEPFPSEALARLTTRIEAARS